MGDKMATKGTEIHALEQKIRIIAETLYELGTIKNPSRKEFAIFAQISYDRLKAAWSSGRLSIALEEKIVAAGGFDQADPTWSDQSVPPMNRYQPDNHEYLGRDTVASFREMLRRRHGVAPDIARVVDERPRLVDSNLMTFAFSDSGQGTAFGQPAPLFFTIVLEPGYHPSGFIYGFRRIRLRLRFNEKSGVRIKDRLACGKSVEIGAAILTARGDEHHSEWHLQAETVMLKGEFVTRDDPLCSLIGFGNDERFEAEISVRPLDGTLVDQDGVELGPINKRRIVELLSAKRLSDAYDSQGWISLGIQTLRIIRGDRE
jgi:hypothetical protein